MNEADTPTNEALQPNNYVSLIKEMLQEALKCSRMDKIILCLNTYLNSSKIFSDQFYFVY